MALAAPGLLRPLRFPTLLDIQLNLAKNWLWECQNYHISCHPSQQRLPRRVIDVSPGHDPFLFESSGEVFGTWVALSHCWGTENTFKTTRETYTSMCLGIRWDALPKTFQDAIAVTRKLGVQYLWIDSICIIQDDGGEDFNREASKMCDIYRESLLTIAAGRASGDVDGFVTTRAFPIPSKISATASNFNHNKMQLLDPLHQRAWTFQEIILPHRLLTFGSAEMYWECEEQRFCECGKIQDASSAFDGNEIECVGRTAYRKYSRFVIPERQYIGQPSRFAQYFDALLSNASEPELKLALDQWNPQKDYSEIVTFYSYWRTTLVPEYTQRRLSNVSDKLIALAAIIEDIKSGMGDTYLAGLWKGDLAQGLLWESVGWVISKKHQSNRIYGFPSWTWASVSSPVRQYVIHETASSQIREERILKSKDFRIIYAHCETLADSAHGTFIKGNLKVTGKAFSAIIRSKSSSKPQLYYQTPRGSESEPISISNISISLDTPLDSDEKKVELLIIGKSSRSSSDIFLILGRDRTRIGIGHSNSLIDSPENCMIAEFLII